MLGLTSRIVAFLIASSATTLWGITFETVHTFPGAGSEGTKPWATLTIGPDRNLYGTTTEGGAGGVGTAFKVTTANGFAVLGSFDTATTGKSSKARLVNPGNGKLYGATSDGTGTAGDPIGTVFELDPAGGLTPIFALPGDGSTPAIPFSLTSGSSGVLHVLGSSPGGIWAVPINGAARTPVFNFPPSGDDGQFPQSIIRGSDGLLYGVTAGTTGVGTTPGRRGTVFRIQPNGTGFQTIKDCVAETGITPLGGLVEGPDGTFYGTMSGGGANQDGVVFRITPAGVYSVIHDIDDNAPRSDLLLASDGKLYGTSYAGGTSLYGSVFRLNTDGSGFQVIHTFNRTNGAYPKAGLVQADDGNLYGVTTEGGADNVGTIFRIDLNLPAPPVNRPPVASEDQGFSSGSAVAVNVLANDFDADGDTLTLTIESQPAHGTVQADAFGNITYSPGAGYVDYDSFNYRITDPGGLYAIGEVNITNSALPPPWTPGAYNGILNLDPTLDGNQDIPRGQLIINVQPTGVFTGKLFTQKKRFTVRGLFNQDGTAIALVKLPRQGTAVIFMAVGEGGFVRVALFAKETWSGYINPLPASGPTATESYTLLSTSNNVTPQGMGYGFAKIFTNNIVVGVGRLNDGSKLAFGTTRVMDGAELAIPVFAEPIRGGSFAVFAFSGGAPPLFAFAGGASWVRPPAAKPTLPYAAGFIERSGFYFCTFVPPEKTALPVDFGSDQHADVSLGGVVSESAGITAVGTRLVPTAPLQAFSINRKTGIFSGRMKSGRKVVPFQGAVYQSTKDGWGVFMIDKLPGEVHFVAD